MYTKLFAVAALVVTAALAGCATTGVGTTTYATTSPIVIAPAVPTATGSGSNYNVFPDQNSPDFGNPMGD
jgi:curli biogenesis system outer membrane secretion channel CsgG